MTFLIAAFIVILDITCLWGIKLLFPQFASRHGRGLRLSFIIQSATALTIVLGGYFFDMLIKDYRIVTIYYYIFGIMSSLYIPKSAFALFLFFDWAFLKIKKWYLRKFNKLPKRTRHLVSVFGFWTSIPVFGIIIWGIAFGRFNFTVEHVEIKITNLPKDFEGYKIVQISDIHTGSFAGLAHRFEKAVSMINEQNPDIIVITGDFVNNFADEMSPFIPVFSHLNARDGKFAVLGNHDYGGYSKWKNIADSIYNHKAIINGIEQMGFDLLNNESKILTRCDSSQIAIIGIENQGKLKRHPKRGDLVKATEQVRDIPVKLLLSHDPTFWDKNVVGKTDIALTLAGHTHGMQLALKLGKKRYNPAFIIRSRYLAGLYQKGDQCMYINRGLGVIGFPGRVGMSPEITVITLRASNVP